LEPGPPAAAGGEDGRLGPPDEEFERTLHALRADPGGFIALASMPVTDAVATANDLLKHGIEAAFVPFDDPNAPPVPEEVLRAGGVI
jgi:hypothetical protein